MPQLKLTRNQLAAFLKDHESIKQFEQLFTIVDTISPDVVSEISLLAGISQATAVEALAQITRLADILETWTPAQAIQESNNPIPPMQDKQDADNLTPPVQIGTLGQQQADRVSITGGEVTAQLRNDQTILLGTTVSLTDGAGADIGTLLNAPAAGDPTKWIAIDDNGTTRYIPTWS